jgi:hypothetical protein
MGRPTSVNDAATITGGAMVATSKGSTQMRRGTTARISALVIVGIALITGCHPSVLVSAVAPPSHLGTVVGFMEGEGGAITMQELREHAGSTWSICGDVTATQLGNRSPTATVSTDGSGQFTLELPHGTYRLASTNTVGCAYAGKPYVTPACVAQGTCSEAIPAPVEVEVTADHTTHTALYELVP